MRHTASFLMAMLLVPGVGSAQERETGWIGKVTPPVPSGHVELMGSCVGVGQTGEALCRESISVQRDEQSKLRYIVATRELRGLDGRPVGGSRPLGLVTDALSPAALDDRRNEVVIGLCQRDGQDDGRIVAVLKPTNTEWLTRLVAAWRLDSEGRLQTLPLTGVRCRNEGFGYDG